MTIGVDMRHLGYVAAAAALMTSSPLLARVVFHQYDGPELIKEGHGGTKVVKHGIEYWTAGAPTKRHRILGTIIDSRSSGDGSAIGSRSVAKKVKEVGGDAVVFLGQNVNDGGVFQGIGPGYTYAIPMQNEATSLAVIAYLKE